jgi:hypothetical protein
VNSLPSKTSTNEQINLHHTKLSSHCFNEASQLSELYVRLEAHYSARVVITLSQTKHAEFSLKALYKCFMIRVRQAYINNDTVFRNFYIHFAYLRGGKKDSMTLISFVVNSVENITIPSCEVTYFVGEAFTDK